MITTLRDLIRTGEIVVGLEDYDDTRPPLAETFKLEPLLEKCKIE